MKSGLSKSQVICIILLWVVLCIMLFTIPSSSSLGEKIFTAIASGVIIWVALSKDYTRKKRRK